MLAEASTAASALVVALRSPGQTVAVVAGVGEVDALPSLIAQALQWERRAAESEAKRGAQANALRAQQAEQKRVGALILRTETELQGHEAAHDVWHARLFLPSDSASETVKARLDELDALARQSAGLNDARQVQGHHNAVVNDVEARAAQLALLVGEPGSLSVDDFADGLRRRLAASRESEHERNTLTRDQGRAQQSRRQAETELEQQSAVLARLRLAAGVATADLLPGREESAARKRQTQTHLSTLREQLCRHRFARKKRCARALPAMMPLPSRANATGPGWRSDSAKWSRQRRAGPRNRRGELWRRSTHRIARPRLGRAWNRLPPDCGRRFDRGRA